MFRDTLNDRGGEVVAPPKSCPFCQSPKISATGKVTAQSYYRCNGCGQVWHPERLAGGSQVDYRRSR
jgi:transposase-like protein